MPGFDLSKWERDYQEAPTEREGREDLPDGNYQVRVSRVEMKESKKGNPMLSWELDVIGGRFVNRKLFRNNVLVSADNIKYLKADLYTCGVTLTSLNELNDERTLGKLIGVTLEVTQKTKGDNKNVYFNKRITLNAPQRQAAAPAWNHAEDDSVPF